MLRFIILLWGICLLFIYLFHSALGRILIDGTALTLCALGIGYGLTLFYQSHRYRVTIEWLRVVKD